MGLDKTENKHHGIANFAALKTAIVNGEAQLVKELIGNQVMPDIEKSYLIELAQLNNNQAIIRQLKAVPLKS